VSERSTIAKKAQNEARNNGVVPKTRGTSVDKIKDEQVIYTAGLTAHDLLLAAQNEWELSNASLRCARFIVQEDDVIFSENIVAYFYTWLYFLQNHTNGKLLPGLYDTEISDINQEKYVSPRLTNGTFFKIGGETFFRSGHSIGGRSLILTRDLILKNVKRRLDEWTNPARVRGEFNPTVSTFFWMEIETGTFYFYPAELSTLSYTLLYQLSPL
jgi:hypothetical protein